MPSVLFPIQEILLGNTVLLSGRDDDLSVFLVVIATFKHSSRQLGTGMLLLNFLSLWHK